MVLITNRQSNILQDIDSLHLFAQVVSSICKTLDEREILRNAYELLSAFDELVTLGYRENLSIGQIKTFLEMESHEERIQEIISRVCSAIVTDEVHKLKLHHRTRSSKPPRRGREELSNWNYNGRRWLGAVDQLLLVHRRILHIRHRLDRLYRTHTTATKPRRIRALS